MLHEREIYDMCADCIGHGIITRSHFATIDSGRRIMRFVSEPCPHCEGLGFLRHTQRTELVDEDADHPDGDPPG